MGAEEDLPNNQLNMIILFSMVGRRFIRCSIMSYYDVLQIINKSISITSGGCVLFKSITAAGMADDEDTQAFRFTPEGGKAGPSSRDYSGRGISEYPNKDQYQGEYVEGVRQGKGKYLYVNGDRYEGDFRQNKKHGIGKLTYKDKGEYYGK